jgi:hypothetical protein
VALWQQMRLSVELGFAADEMLQEESQMSADMVFARVAWLLRDDVQVGGASPD